MAEIYSRQALQRLATMLAPVEGYNLTALSGVRMLRSDRPLQHTPVLYDPGIVFVFQGGKRGYWGQECYRYGAGQYLVVTLPIPFSMETDASADEPLLALYCELDMPLVASLLHTFDQYRAQAGNAAAILTAKGPQTSQSEDTSRPAMAASDWDEALQASLFRLLEALADPLEAHMLAQARLAEVYFRVLTGEQQPLMRQALAGPQHLGKIATVLAHIHRHYAQPLDVPLLADLAGMSEPGFYQHFRGITRYSPMQYVKFTRLHQARLLMLHGRISAVQACHEVGYESPSQFSREFRRLFGLSPRQEVERLRLAYALPPYTQPRNYVASH